MSKSFIAILVVAIGLMAGLFVLAGGKDDSISDSKFEGDAKVIQANDHTSGNPDSKVTLIEYGDFECPACLGFFPIITQLKEEMGDEFHFSFRHLPLTTLHPNALAAHRASEAAHAQGKFWEMHDLLYETQTQWSAQSGSDIGEATSFFEGLASQLDLDVEMYKTDFASDATLNFINTQADSGKQFDATGTPTLILNGEKIATPASYDDLKAIIDAEISNVSGESAPAPAEVETSTETN